MNTDRGTTACAACGITFDQHPGTGRKRSYCTVKCRRSAEQGRIRTTTGAPRRTTPTLTSEHVRAGADAELITLLRTFAGAVEDAGRARAVLRVRLSYTDRDCGRIIRYGAVVGADRPPRDPRGSRTAGAGAASRQAGPRLAAALRLWCERAGANTDVIAHRAGIDGRHLSDLLDGRRQPSWPSVHSLVASVGGDVDGARALWEIACGIDHRLHRTREDLSGMLTAALRVLRLTHRPCRPDTFPDPARSAATGEPGASFDTMPDRNALAAASVELDFPVEELLRLWSDAHAADEIPAGRGRARRHHRDGQR
ncbi:hypothetical protein OG948_60255 (plasmid) [Embleya sp. NBC_00888]|uniref:helix-turn-helix domain-containing protein n=1 Tax=Embleya sp. NBC_00888 TaxID=2975960 RepID=UPI002F90C6B2|nr:hypothetical protein OG948_60255 [Embleya sp. NBC_00888]